MLLQKIVLPPADLKYTEMYIRGSDTLEMKKGGFISFDTYFNSFSYTKYRDYTRVEEITFSVRFDGRIKLELCVFDGEEHVVSYCESENIAELSVTLSALSEKGFLYPKITALTDTNISDCGYYTDAEPSSVSCCISFCTFKREEYVLKNLKLLKEHDFSFIDRVFVIDNGKTLDCSALSDDFVKVYQNRNYGGSGGFTRGLIEAEEEGFSHVILMDDDVELFPEKLEQMTVFMALLKDEFSSAHFSAAMLSNSKPYVQYEMGAFWNGRKIINSKHMVDVRDRKTLLDNLDNENVQYGAWWCFCLPVSDIEKFGLPYPFFIKFDDVEYGLRCCKDSRIISMNGVCVRHEDFDVKFSMHLEYYSVRNQLVMNETHGLQGMGGVIGKLFSVTAKHMLYYRYDNLELVYRAFNDFLKGAQFFIECDDEKLNTELMRSAAKLIPLESIPQWTEELRNDDHYGSNLLTLPMILTLGGHIVPSFLLKKDIKAVPLSRLGLSDTFLRKGVIQYQLGGNTGIFTKRSLGKFLKYAFKSFGMMIKIIFTYGRASKSFKDNKNIITSMEYWKEHLGIN